MKDKFVFIMLLCGIAILTSTTSSYALDTYVGIKILNLTDDPSHSCVGETGYGNQGRIRALSSILPNYPIYFNLTKQSDNSLIWEGNSTDDDDFAIGDTMWLPNTVNLSLGETYNLFFDVDAIRIYLPITSYNGFIATDDDNYWTLGYLITNNHFETMAQSVASSCSYSAMSNEYSLNGMLISSQRNSTFHPACSVTGTAYYCTGKQIIATGTSTQDFKIDNMYLNLYQPNIGNFDATFTFN